MPKFGKLIQDLRINAGMTLREVAEGLGMRVTHLSDIEHGRRRPFSPDQIEIFAQMTNTNGRELYQLAVQENRSIELPAFKNENATGLAYALARADSQAFEDDVVRRLVEELKQALERKPE